MANDKEKAKKLQQAYRKLNKTKKGREICKVLEDSETTYYIRPLDNAWHYCSPGAAAKHKAECPDGGNTVYLDTEKVPTLTEASGQVSPSMEVVMGHELGHATGTFDDGPGQMNNVLINENPIRQELGIPNRTTYSTPPGQTSTIGPYKK